jgi:hypothetical protein
MDSLGILCLAITFLLKRSRSFKNIKLFEVCDQQLARCPDLIPESGVGKDHVLLFPRKQYNDNCAARHDQQFANLVLLGRIRRYSGRGEKPMVKSGFQDQFPA